MQDTILKVTFANNAEANDTVCPKLPTPSIALFEESLRARLETLALDAHDHLQYSLQTNAEDLLEQLEIQTNELGFLINNIRWFQWCNEKLKEEEEAATAGKNDNVAAE